MGRSFQEWNRAKKFSLLSEETIKCLTGVLRQNFDWDEGKIDDCIMDLHGAKTLSICLEMGDPKVIKRRYTKALGAIKKLDDALLDFEVPEIETLTDLVAGCVDDEILAKFDVAVTDQSINGTYGESQGRDERSGGDDCPVERTAI